MGLPPACVGFVVWPKFTQLSPLVGQTIASVFTYQVPDIQVWDYGVDSATYSSTVIRVTRVRQLEIDYAFTVCCTVQT